MATPSFVLAYDALGALATAKLDDPLEAILLLYATGDVKGSGRSWNGAAWHAFAMRLHRKRLRMPCSGFSAGGLRSPWTTGRRH